MRMASKGILKPEALPPSAGAAEMHALRAHLQICDWAALITKSKDPIKYGWACESNNYSPIPNNDEIAPPMIREYISCGCKGACNNNKCSCVRNGLKCVSCCTNCSGITCENVEVIVSASDQEDD